MPKCCFCPDCKTGYASDRIEKKNNNLRIETLFSVPKDDSLYEKWKEVIPRADRELTRNDFVCALHFKEEEINRYFETRLTDGSDWKLDRVRPTLKPGTIPSIFPYVSKPRKLLTVNRIENKLPTDDKKQKLQTDYVNENKLQTNKPKLKLQTESQTHIVKRKKRREIEIQYENKLQSDEINENRLLLEYSENDWTPSENDWTPNENDLRIIKMKQNELSLDVENIEIVENSSFTYEYLKNNLSAIYRKSWSTTLTEDFISVMYWNKHIIERWIIIEEDLSIKVFILGIGTSLENKKRLLSLHDVYKVMESLEEA